MPFQPRPELIKALQPIAEDLFEAIDPGRVTIRFDTTNDPDYPVLAEARAPGMSSLTGQMSLGGYRVANIHAAPTFASLRDERNMIVQRDVREFQELCGCLSQMLAPVEWKGRFVGVVSVHGIEARDWTEEEKAAIRGAAARVERELAQAEWIEIPR